MMQIQVARLVPRSRLQALIAQDTLTGILIGCQRKPPAAGASSCGDHSGEPSG